METTTSTREAASTHRRPGTLAGSLVIAGAAACPARKAAEA
ncbi:hypothetical protein ABK046_08845 [Streptomyces caeruleatus]